MAGTTAHRGGSIDLSGLSDTEFLELVREQLESREAFTPVRDSVETLLTVGRDQSRRRMDLLSEVSRTRRRGRLLAEAQRGILDRGTVGSAAVADLLATPGSGRSAAQRLRADGALIGLKVGNRYVHPVFQFDHDRHRLHPIVATVNQRLGAATDPWAAASWWLSPNGWLDPGVAPADLVPGIAEQDAELLLRIASGLSDD